MKKSNSQLQNWQKISLVPFFKTSKKTFTGWNLFKHGVFPGLYFSAFELNTEINRVNLLIQSKCMKIRTRKNSVLGHFSRNVSHHHQQNMGIRIFFISSAKLKLAKNLAKTKQHSEIELLLFGNYSLSSSTLSFKSNRSYFKNRTEAKCICFNEVI